MDLQKLEISNRQLAAHLKAHRRVSADLKDIILRIELEDAKPIITSYLITSKEWLLERARILESALIWIEKRLLTIMHTLN